MIDVLMLGILVSLVKLAALATVVPALPCGRSRLCSFC